MAALGPDDAAGQSMVAQPGQDDDNPIDDLTWDLQCLGMRKIMESVVGEDAVKNLYTILILTAASIVGILSRSRTKGQILARRQQQFQYVLYVVSVLIFVGFCFVMLGYGMGYTTGYGERISHEQLNTYQFAMTSMAMRIFWSFLLSCGIAFMYSYTSQCIPCCPM